MAVRCHTPAENVTAWLTMLMSEYLQISEVKQSLASMAPEDLLTPY
jgi:hypothetical protein